MVMDADLELDSATNMVMISAMADGNQVVPMGYETAFVLTSGANIVIEDFNTTGDFMVGAAGNYQVHVLVAELDDMMSPNFLDLSAIVPGTTTGADAIALLDDNDICAALQFPGTPVTVSNFGGGGGTDDCTAQAGMALVMDTDIELSDVDSTAMISATADGNQVVPMGYETAFVLTMGTDLVIMDFNTTGDFTVAMAGDYQVHVLIAELDDMMSADFLDLSVITPGVTTGLEALSLLDDNDICAALQVPGTSVTVSDNLGGGGGGGTNCTADAGTASVDEDDVDLDDNGMATITATLDGTQSVPTDFETAFVLTTGSDFTIMDYNTTGTFMVSMVGDYQVHAFVAELTDPMSSDYIDLANTITLGQTTGGDVVALVNTAAICAALQVPGTSVTVNDALTGGNKPTLNVGVFPNPAHERTTVDLQTVATPQFSADQVVVRLLDANGRVLQTHRFDAVTQRTQFDLDLSDLKKGVYYLQTVRGTQVVSERLTKL